MNRIEPALRAVMTEAKIANLVELSAKIDLPKSSFSKIFTGDIGLSPANLRKLVSGTSSRREHQFEILRAHLLDEVDRSGFPSAELSIELRNAPKAGEDFSDVPHDLQKILRTVADQITKRGDVDLNAGLKWTAAAIEEGQARENRVYIQIKEGTNSGLIAVKDRAGYRAGGRHN
jgi:hypothetical protein